MMPLGAPLSENSHFLRATMHNEAVRADPPEIYSWYIFALTAAACLGGMLFGWDTGAIGGILAMAPVQLRFGYANHSPKVKSTMEQNIVSTLQAGCFSLASSLAR
ncbi:quinate permease [Fusarium albosuccineum]|uniref:Quinate permease n=1 Tax=Fusarium albosuccineum TaxID=1237068 RepID=A0A8H4PD16_9HYPO|nr:quinate permease [Fusarium albosuccineum]